MQTKWNEQNVTCYGAVFFRGAMPPRAEEAAYLQKRDITLASAVANENEAWAMTMTHPDWGTARLMALRKPMPIPKVLVKYDGRLDENEKKDAVLGQSSLGVQVDGVTGNILRDRKRMLRFLDAIMDSDGLVAIDLTAQRFWSAAALADELRHDADLDIDSLLTFHSIYRDDSDDVHWLHSHGLAEIGFFDFDVLRPSRDLLSARCHDFARAVAFQIVEGKVQPSTPMARIISNGPLQLVDVADFNRRASRRDRELRDVGPEHNENRTILCDPAKRTGWLSKIFKGPPTPSRMLSAPQGEYMVFFTTAASRLMAERAVKTYGMLRELSEEFADLGAKAIAKLGYRIDGGGPDDLEHMWFEIHAMKDDAIDATLGNQPHGIAAMKEGDRSLHSISRMTDWMLMLPTGLVNPRQLRPARTARQRREEILAARKR